MSVRHQSEASYWAALANAPAIDWNDVAARLPFAADMKTCIQDPTYHAEGDVWTHTCMVVRALCERRAAIAQERWPGLFLAALLHDIAKPATRSEVIENGRLRVHHYGHARLGAMMAWEFLWRQGVARTLREQVFHLVRWHQRPFHMLFDKSIEANIIRYSLVGAWPELIALAQADNLGRISPNTEETATILALLEAEVEERHCLGAAWPFASDAARVWFCRADGRSPYYDPPPPKGSEVVVLSGLPGAGKDTYCRTHFHGLPQVPLDAWRERLDVEPDETQGRVIKAALEEARVYLRAKRSFVWNATNVSRLNRDRATGLCLDYDARVEIHALDPPPERLFAQNRQRGAVVPASVLDRLIAKWEPPSVAEAHAVKWVD